MGEEPIEITAGKILSKEPSDITQEEFLLAIRHYRSINRYDLARSLRKICVAKMTEDLPEVIVSYVDHLEKDIDKLSEMIMTLQTDCGLFANRITEYRDFFNKMKSFIN